MTRALELRQVSKSYGRRRPRCTRCVDVDSSVAPASSSRSWGRAARARAPCYDRRQPRGADERARCSSTASTSASMSRNDRARLRRRSIGYVFQDFNLLAGLTAVENVSLPLELDGVRAKAARAAAARGARGARCHRSRRHFPDDLSGGERQRVAIARAVVGERSCCWPTSPPVPSTRSTARR